jgi:hypothetical protein
MTDIVFLSLGYYLNAFKQVAAQATQIVGKVIGIELSELSAIADQVAQVTIQKTYHKNLKLPKKILIFFPASASGTHVFPLKVASVKGNYPVIFNSWGTLVFFPRYIFSKFIFSMKKLVTQCLFFFFELGCLDSRIMSPTSYLQDYLVIFFIIIRERGVTANSSKDVTFFIRKQQVNPNFREFFPVPKKMCFQKKKNDKK